MLLTLKAKLLSSPPGGDMTQQVEIPPHFCYQRDLAAVQSKRWQRSARSIFSLFQFTEKWKLQGTAVTFRYSPSKYSSDNQKLQRSRWRRVNVSQSHLQTSQRIKVIWFQSSKNHKLCFRWYFSGCVAVLTDKLYTILGLWRVNHYHHHHLLHSNNGAGCKYLASPLMTFTIVFYFPFQLAVQRWGRD